MAALKMCPCDCHGNPIKECHCPPSLVSRYQKHISGPLLDRIDIFVDAPASNIKTS